MRQPQTLSREMIEKLLAGEKQLTQIRADVEKAKAAKVPNIHLLEQKCDECQEQIELLKEHYVPRPKKR